LTFFMQLLPLATPGCAGDERWSPGAAGFMEQYRRMALGGIAPGGTCSLGLGSVGDPLRQREREKLLSSPEYVEESMKGRGWLCRSLVGTQGWSARKPRSGASAARLRGGRSISPTFVVLVEDLLQLASATASRSYPVPHGYGSWSGRPVQPRRVLWLFGYNTRPEILA
jgi:hypothetical protein